MSRLGGNQDVTHACQQHGGRDTHHGGVIHGGRGVVIVAGGRAFRAGKRDGRQDAHDENLCYGKRREGSGAGCGGVGG